MHSGIFQVMHPKPQSSLDHFMTPRRNPVPWTVTPQPLHPSRPWAIMNVLAVCRDLPVLMVAHKWNPPVPGLGDWFQFVLRRQPCLQRYSPSYMAVSPVPLFNHLPIMSSVCVRALYYLPWWHRRGVSAVFFHPLILFNCFLESTFLCSCGTGRWTLSPLWGQSLSNQSLSLLTCPRPFVQQLPERKCIQIFFFHFLVDV